MTSFKFALVLFIGLQGCALTFDIESLDNDALKPAGDICQDCTKIFELFVDLLSNAELQKKIMDGIENLCDHLPGPAVAAKLCKEEVEKMFPVAIKLITSALKPADICKSIGLCGSCDKQKMLSYFVNEALQVAMTNQNTIPATQCSFCIFLVKTLESLLPKERTESAVIQLLEEICHIVPSSYRAQCESIIGKISKQVLDAILSYASPQVICSLIHLCKGQEAPLVDPCTLTTYRCSDFQTALKCGTVFYCQRFAWKPVN